MSERRHDVGRIIDQNDQDLIDAWEAIHPNEDDDVALVDKRGNTRQAGAEHIFTSMTRYLLDAPGT